MIGHRKLETSDYAAILKRRKWNIILPIVLMPIIALAITFFIKPQYMSQTMVLIDQQKVPTEFVKSVVQTDLDARLSSMKEQILSRSRVEPLVDHYNLYGNTHMTMDEKIDEARSHIMVKPITPAINVKGTMPGFFISFTTDDPRTAQLVCGEITAMFVNENLRERQASAENTTDFLKGQVDDAKHLMDEQDRKMADFQSKYFGKLPTEENTNINMLTSLNTQLEATTQALARMEQDKTYQETMLSQLQPNGPMPGSESKDAKGVAPVTMVANTQKETKQTELRKDQADLSLLEGQYTADYPDVITLKRRIAELQKEIAGMPDQVPSTTPGVSTPSGSINAQNGSLAVQQLRAQIRSSDLGIQQKKHEQESIQARISNYQARIAASPEVDEQFKELTRDDETAKKNYDDLQNKMNESKRSTDLERRQQGEQFHVMDEPNLPDAPVFPKRIFFFLGGLGVGILFAAVFAGLAEYRDTALRTERDVWAFTQLPTLAVIGFVETGDAGFTKKRGWKFWQKKPKGEAAVAGA